MGSAVITGSWESDPASFSILVHGGAGNVPEASRAHHAEGARRAALAGYEILQRGGAALDAVQRAVEVLEDDPAFNAGTGACLNADGHIELDAAIMSGADLSAGAVAALPPFKNPIAIARAVLAAKHHVLYAAEGAARFALANGFAREDEARMITESARKRLAVVKGGGHPDGWAGGTVGAVARDRDGHVAAATSTGGKVNKNPGRVGDSPILGAGTYADDAAGACSNTGDGEAFLRTCLANAMLEWMRSGKSIADAAREGLILLGERAQGGGGTILVDPRGRLAWARTTTTMGWGAMADGWAEPRSGT
jgi:beta-aspartyl-peptidase (threonine type)